MFTLGALLSEGNRREHVKGTLTKGFRPHKQNAQASAHHVIAAAVLLNADVALGTVFSVGTNVVGCFRVVCTLREPFPDCGAVCGGVIHLTTLET